MLNSLIDTKSKRKLLNALFKFPKRSFYQVELKELTRISSRTLSLILSELVKEDVLRMFVKNRRKYFHINPHLDWYDELRELVSDEPVLGLDPSSKLVKGLGGLKVAILTGVFTGQPRIMADLVLVGNSPKPKQLNKVLSDLEKLVGQDVNYCEMDEEEYEYRQHMHDRFIRDVLDNTHVIVFDKLKKKKKKNNV